jgi:hypothetical protein
VYTHAYGSAAAQAGNPPPIFEKFHIFSHFQSTLPLLLPLRAATGFIIKNHLNKK